MDQFLSVMWMKDLTSWKVFQLFLFLEQIMECNILRNQIKKKNRQELERSCNFPIRKRRTKGAHPGTNSVIHVVVFGKDNAVSHFKKKKFPNNFEQEPVKSCNFLNIKRRNEGALA